MIRKRSCYRQGRKTKKDREKRLPFESITRLFLSITWTWWSSTQPSCCDLRSMVRSIGCVSALCWPLCAPKSEMDFGSEWMVQMNGTKSGTGVESPPQEGFLAEWKALFIIRMDSACHDSGVCVYMYTHIYMYTHTCPSLESRRNNTFHE